ncbi:flagellar hook-basal body complex protein FliE [Sneathiella limimaris]|uniref:flagellar hook-basal body complex protein FliE n=1 Tax=Sneathiella limimaris TaxID=1964213 RepID=UPI00146C3D1F|nr:flagellar hook-basal body complex protein FliE [Sneathiella limimaris]
MVETSPISATQAYAKALEQAADSKGQGAAVGVDEVKSGPSFSELLDEAGQSAIQDGMASEKTSLQSLTGEAGLVDIVTAVSSAEVTLETVVSVRDRVIQAYQDIIKMPI